MMAWMIYCLEGRWPASSDLGIRRSVGIPDCPGVTVIPRR